MGIINDIKNQNSKTKELNALDEYYKTEKNIINNKYDDCNHDVIIKFYDSALGKHRNEVVYICLACEKVIDDKKELENKEIIDYTACENGTISVGDHQLLILYLRSLVDDMFNNNKDFTDDKALNLLKNNAALKMIPKEYIANR